MDRKLFLALLLSAVVVALTPWLFPGQPKQATPGPPADSTSIAASSTIAAVASPAVVPASVLGNSPARDSVAASRPAGQTTALGSPHAVFVFSSAGAAPVSVTIRDYANQRPPHGTVVLENAGAPLLRYRIVTPSDTIALDRIEFRTERTSNVKGWETVRYVGAAGNETVTISYALAGEGYSLHMSGSVSGTSGPTFLLIDMPATLASFEADTLDDQRHLAYAFKPKNDNASSVAFSRLEPGEQKLEEGPLTWAAIKNKYFVVGILAEKTKPVFSEVLLAGGTRTAKIATHGNATVVQATRAGEFGFDIYAGPQEQEELVAMGRDFDHVNPYGWAFMRGIVQPIAGLVIRLLLWMHRVMQLSYGWVLVIFGVAIRFLLWPLNQKAMRSSMRMQEIQPKLMEVQKKYQNNPEKQREEIMRVYRENNASPFTALSGCLPMLIPMPIFFALFFVFQNTIEFRGVPFLWLSDISIKDPIYILPLLMGISMFVLSWIGLKNSPPNPQAKMMGYVFPVMMTVMLANLAAGLNLYYTAQNLAALPQQWILTKERTKQQRK